MLRPLRQPGPGGRVDESATGTPLAKQRTRGEHALRKEQSDMLSILGHATKLCDGITRREMLRVGGLAFSGLTLADVLRLRATADSNTGRGKSLIMIWL